MPTPDFEEWLRRQDWPIEKTLDVETWLEYLQEEIGLRKGSLDVARDVYEELFDYLPMFGIRAFEIRREIHGEPFIETRYAIKGMRGAFGYERALEIAEQRATEAGQFDIARWLRMKRLYG